MDMAEPPAFASYQDEHIARLTNLEGTTVAETLLVVVVPQLVFLLQVLLALMPSLAVTSLTYRFSIEFIFVIAPQLAVCTILSNYATHIGITSIIACAVIALITQIKSANLMNTSIMEIQLQLQNTQIFITTYRAGILLLTVICILAVDFPVFPQRFAKTETYGFGLMDIGVGLFIVTNGIVSRNARGIPSTTLNRIRYAFSSSAIILLLGFGRLLSVKASGYHEHISEYGIHWNFFFTLAVTKIVASIICIFLDAKYCIWLGIALISTYQYALVSGLSKYILEDLSEPFENGFSYYLYVNRSGLVSCIGFISIYLIAVTLGHCLISVKRATILQWVSLVIQLYIASAILMCSLWVTQNYVEKVSRRLANLTFVLWVVSFTTVVLATALTGDIVSTVIKQLNRTVVLQRKSMKKSRMEHKSMKAGSYDIHRTSGSLLMATINRNGLKCFILANVATGIINFSVQTIHASTLASMCILTFYTFFTCLCSFYMEISNIE